MSASQTGQTPIPPEPGTRPRRRPIPIVSTIVAVVVLGGVMVNCFTSAERDETGAIVGAGEVSADELQLGDCLLLPEDAGEVGFEFTEITAVPCSEPHWAEVYAVYLYSGQSSSYPGEEVIDEFAAEKCVASYEHFTGVAYEDESTMDMTWFQPTRGSWGQGDRTVHCLAVEINGGHLVGSQEGKGAPLGDG